MQLNSNYLVQRLEELFLNGRWIANTNYKEQLEQTNWADASRQYANLNSIVKLSYHIWYYLQGINMYFETERLAIKDQYSFDAAAIDSEQSWEDFKTDFILEAARFIHTVRELTEVQLASDFFDPKYGTYLRNIDGMLEHAYYHLGQIVLLRKLLKAPAVSE